MAIRGRPGLSLYAVCFTRKVSAWRGSCVPGYRCWRHIRKIEDERSYVYQGRYSRCLEREYSGGAL